ncbi:hypothetical protein [Agrococcus sp. Ld7]|uniref:hypothetical protein n=1 Tax=Agrococcus sp. Ld7 TaxID=649148 RepID=UPI00386C632A
MMLAAAIVTGLALGYLLPTDGPWHGRSVVRALAALVVVGAAALAWPRLSPHDNWPALAFGGAVVTGVLIALQIERMKDVRALAAEDALPSH